MYLILKHQLYKNKTIQFVDTKTFKFESLQYTARLTTETGIITNRIFFYCISTFFFPPPGTWPMFFREPTLDWTFAKSAFSDLISSFPPPETQTHTHTHSTINDAVHWSSPEEELRRDGGWVCYLECGGCCLWSHTLMSHYWRPASYWRYEPAGRQTGMCVRLWVLVRTTQSCTLCWSDRVLVERLITLSPDLGVCGAVGSRKFFAATVSFCPF